MKRETKILLGKAKESLILAIEFFNRPHDVGRATASLIFLDHAFEMLMKASILHKNGTIRDDKNSQKTIGFKECLQRGISNQAIKFISEEQGISLQAINGERDAAQHHILQISEQQLYLFLQSGVTMFDDILFKVFNERLQRCLPRRVLPVATTAPLDIERLFRIEINEIRNQINYMLEAEDDADEEFFSDFTDPFVVEAGDPFEVDYGDPFEIDYGDPFVVGGD